MITTAQDLLDELLAIKETYGTLDVPIGGFSYELEDRFPLHMLDVFTDGEDEHLHSIDINF